MLASLAEEELTIVKWEEFYVNLIDTSNRKSVNSNHCSFLFLHSIYGIKLKLFKVHFVENETFDKIVNVAVNSVKKFNIKNKIV